MGALDDAKKAMEDMQAMAAQGGSQGGQIFAAAQAENEASRQVDIDPNDPVLAPIEGVDLDRYVELCVGMADMGTDTAAHEKHAVANGIPAGRWSSISDAWFERMKADPRLMTEFNTRYGKAAGIR